MLQDERNYYIILSKQKVLQNEKLLNYKHGEKCNNIVLMYHNCGNTSKILLLGIRLLEFFSGQNLSYLSYTRH